MPSRLRQGLSEVTSLTNEAGEAGLDIRAFIKPLMTGFAILVSTQCLAANVPERFRGVWQAVEEPGQTCRTSDWNSDRHTDTHLKIDPGLVRYHESDCRFKTVTRPKPVFDSGAVHVVMTCEGEGERWSSTEVWKILSIGGRDVLAMANVSKQRPAISLYRKCGEGDDRTKNTPKNDDIGSAAGASVSTDDTSKLWGTLTAGRHCFAQKDEGAEFSLSVEPSGAASFAIDVANPRTKHLCSAGGAATKTTQGWRYVDTSRPGDTCRLDIDVSDRIRFRFENGDCERRYCGARASLSSLAFSAQDKLKSCPR